MAYEYHLSPQDLCQRLHAIAAKLREVDAVFVLLAFARLVVPN